MTHFCRIFVILMTQSIKLLTTADSDIKIYKYQQLLSGTRLQYRELFR